MKRQGRELLLGRKTGRFAAMAVAVIMVVGMWVPVFGTPVGYDAYAQDEPIAEVSEDENDSEAEEDVVNNSDSEENADPESGLAVDLDGGDSGSGLDKDIKDTDSDDSLDDVALEPEPIEALGDIVALDEGDPAGEGTEESPYLIGSVADLQWMSTQIRTAATNPDYRTKYYELTNDIDMTGITDFMPITGPTNPTAFAGSFDGKGHVISNLRMMQSVGGLGLFGTCNGATIKNVALTNLYLNSTATGGGCGGLVAGSNGPVTIANCYVSGELISGGLTFGGIIGAVGGALTVENCRFDGSIKGTYNVGGIVGQANGIQPTIRNCVVTASITGTDSAQDGRIGGIIGNRMNASGDGTITNCMVLSPSIDSLAGFTNVGAIWGDRSSGSGTITVTDSYAWKGLNLNGTPLKEILYGDARYNASKNGDPILSWSLNTAAVWPAGLKTGAWTYAAGKIPVMTSFASSMSADFPTYMAEYLVAPEGTANPAPLRSLVESADTLKLTDYPDGWADFVLTLARAKIVLNDAESSEAELAAAVKQLTAAIAALRELNESVLAGNGSEGTPYLISKITDLQKVNRLVNSAEATVRDEYRNKHYKLTADIDMTGVSWSSLGGSAAATAFTGTFDGNDKTISNLTMSGGSRNALFNYTNGATIKNLKVEDVAISGGSDQAGLVVEAAGGTTITDCSVSGTISASSNAVGIAARTNGAFTIKGCSVKITAETSNSGIMSNAAGITGNSQSGANQTILIEDCTAEVHLTTVGGNAAGISAYFAANNAAVTIRNCNVIIGEAHSIQASNYVAGIVATTSTNTTVENCSVTGGSIQAITPTGISYAGGIVGSMPNNANIKIIDCYAETDVQGESSNVGGLVGALEQYAGNGTLSISGSAYIGNVNGTENVGGLVGQSKALTITDCYAAGSVNGTTKVGGLLGHKYNNGDLNINNCLTMASVYGNESVGGILGGQYSSDTGKVTIANSRVLGVAVGTTSMTVARTTGAITGDTPQFNTTNYTQSNTYAWTGMMLGRKTLETTTVADQLYDANRNGQGFLNWALRVAEGWPAALVNNEGAWSYTVGDFPVLTKFEDRIISEFPLYMVSIPTSGTVGDKTALKDVIEAAAALKNADYVQENAMFLEVQMRLMFARQVDDLHDASQAAIDAMTTYLRDGIDELNQMNDLVLEGAGNVGSPFLIPDLDSLQKANRLINSTDAATRNSFRAAHYQLTSDIDMTGESWKPLGGTATGTSFTGIFDGNGKTVSNLELSGAGYVGFFSCATNATIKNLNLQDFAVENTAMNRAAILVASADTNVTIDNCKVSGAMSFGGYAIGGIAGYLQGTVRNCTAEVDMIGLRNSNGSAAGIVGSLYYGTVENCSVKSYSSSGAVSSYGGGVAGIVGGIDTGNNVSTVKNCSADINIMGTVAGGIVGTGSSTMLGAAQPDRIVISDCYYSGMITAPSVVAGNNHGGIAGNLSSNFNISNCRSDGTISMSGNAGGILGRSIMGLNHCYITNCYTTMRIGNGLIAGGISGTSLSNAQPADLFITDCYALNEQVAGQTSAHAIHAFGEGHNNLDYASLSSVKVWDGMLVSVDGTTQTIPNDITKISYANLQTAAGWLAAFKASPWTYAVGKLPVLTNASGDFPSFFADSGNKTVIADTTALFAIIAEANALVEATWMPDSWAAMIAARDAAIPFTYSPTATQAQVDAAVANLRNAIDALEIFKIVTTLLGEGTAASPFLVGSVADYEEMARILEATDFYRGAHYKLTNNIDLGGIVRFSMPYTTVTSATNENRFTGDFDGAGFTISGLSVTGSWGTAMFGYTNGAKIHDFTLTNCLISASHNNTGALVGGAVNTTFENIKVTGSVMGTSNTGGLVGNANGSTMLNCHFEGTVETSKSSHAYWVGGLAGAFGSYMENCSFKGNIIYGGTPQTSVTMGGIAGSFGGDIKGCRVEASIVYRHFPGDGTVNNGANVGGIAGEFNGNSIIDCHFKGDIQVRGENNGGIVGLFRGLLIKDCTTEGDLLMNFPGSHQPPRPTGGIVGNIDTSGGREVVIDNVVTYMGLNGFSQAGGIGGTISGNGKITISNSEARNKYINNSYSDFNVDPFLYGAGYGGFAGELILDNIYIWEGMLINGKTIAQWLQDTYNHKGYENNDNITIGTRPHDPANPPNPPDQGGDPNHGGTTPTNPNSPQWNDNTNSSGSNTNQTGNRNNSSGSSSRNPASSSGLTTSAAAPVIVPSPTPAGAQNSNDPLQPEEEAEIIESEDVPTTNSLDMDANVTELLQRNIVPVIIIIVVVVIVVIALLIRSLRARKQVE